MAKQAFLLHASTPQEPQCLIEERFFQILELPYLAQVLPGQGQGDCVAFSADERWLTSDSDDQTVRVWDLRQPGAKIRLWRLGELGPLVLEGHEDRVKALVFSPDGAKLVSGSEGNTVRLWDLHQPKTPPVLLLKGTDTIDSVAFSLKGTKLAAGGDDNVVRLWDLSERDPKPVVIFRAPTPSSLWPFRPMGLN